MKKRSLSEARERGVPQGPGPEPRRDRDAAAASPYARSRLPPYTDSLVGRWASDSMFRRQRELSTADEQNCRERTGYGSMAGIRNANGLLARVRRSLARAGMELALNLHDLHAP